MSRRLLSGKGYSHGAAAAAFVPTDLTNLKLWQEVAKGGLFKASAGTTAATANSDVVGYLPDWSGGSRTFTSPTDVDGTKPTLQGVGTLPCLRGDGSNDILRLAASLGVWSSGGIGVWAVAFKSNSPALNSFLFTERGATSSPILATHRADSATATTNSVFFRDDSGANNGTPGTLLAHNGSPHVLIVTADGTTIRTYLDNVAGNTGAYDTTKTITLTNTSLFASFAASTAANFYAGDFYGAIVAASMPTSTERGNINNYLKALAGL
jgi:hypothetical protein